MAVDDHSMNRAQADAVFAWLRETADLVGLKDWEILLDTEGPSTDPETGGAAWASCTPTASYREAVIRVSGALLIQPDQSIQNKLVHELVHMFHGDLLEALDNVLSLVPDPDHRAVIVGTVRRYIEDLVDKAARAIVNNAALPSLDAVRAATDARLEETRSSTGYGGGVVV